ncbi:hypothetical protein HRbin02_01318 [Candidatus Calditenuaceae archaeon HR02]|nr:hypothetical protein HRbin02_01318 [Candidatus Calditenuaceae archaeon HR02]
MLAVLGLCENFLAVGPVGLEPTSSSDQDHMVPQAGVIAMLDHGPFKHLIQEIPILIYVR